MKAIVNGHTIVRTNSESQDFHKMIQGLDHELRLRNGEDVQEYFAHFNIIKDIDTVVLAYRGNEVIGCGCFKKFEGNTAEIKRMFVLPAMRGQGVAGSILAELEAWAKEAGYTSVVLETGTFLVEAVRLYQRHGFYVIDNWGQYIGIAESVCMRKTVTE